jgi:hypothetical protein
MEIRGVGLRNDGMALEEEVFRLLQRMLENDDLPYQKELCRLHRRRSYFSADRKANVNFENVIEVFTRDSVDAPEAKPTHVAFFECKDHGRSVEVGRIDEVVGRLNASFGLSMKAYVVTRRSFSSGALQTANSKGIGLIKLMPEGKVTFLMHLQTLDSIETSRREFPRRALLALLSDAYEADGEDFYGLDRLHTFGSMAAMLGDHLKRVASRSRRPSAPKRRHTRPKPAAK